MGYNTSVLILNDTLNVIDNDPGFSKRLVDAICQLRHGKQVQIQSGIVAVETHHNDGYSVVAFGGNTATVLSESLTPYGSEDFKVRI